MLQILRGSHKAGRINHVKVGEQVGADVERVEMLMKVCTCIYIYIYSNYNFNDRFYLLLKLS